MNKRDRKDKKMQQRKHLHNKGLLKRKHKGTLYENTPSPVA